MPPTTGMPSARHASPMPSIASDSCHITSGCSGLPKFRQLTSANGRAPTHARLSAASATSHAVPTRGSTAHQRWLPSVVSANARPVSTPVVGCLSRNTVASPPGADHRVEEQLVVVLRPHPRRVGQHRQQIVRRSSCRSAAVGVGVGVEVGGRLARPVVARRVLVERLRRQVGQHLAVEPIEHAQPAGAGDRSDHRGARPPSARRSRAPRRGSRASRSRASAPATRSS